MGTLQDFLEGCRERAGRRARARFPAGLAPCRGGAVMTDETMPLALWEATRRAADAAGAWPPRHPTPAPFPSAKS